jgi:hypothetical protein
MHMKSRNGNGNMRMPLLKKHKGNMRMSLAHWHGEISVSNIICEPPHFDGSEILNCCTTVTLNWNYVTRE